MEKGKTNNPNGRPAGSKNERTKQWEALGNAIQEVHTKRFNEVLAGMDDEAFARTYLQVLEYFKPTCPNRDTGGSRNQRSPNVHIRW